MQRASWIGTGCLVGFLLVLGCNKSSDPLSDPQTAAQPTTAQSDSVSEPPAKPEGAPPSLDDQVKALTEGGTIKAGEATLGFGQLPEGFPVDLLPPYPGGKIERSALKDGEATLLQSSSDPRDTVHEYYRDFYRNGGWEETTPREVMGRTFVSYRGTQGIIHMTLNARPDGATFFSLVHSR